MTRMIYPLTPKSGSNGRLSWYIDYLIDEYLSVPVSDHHTDHQCDFLTLGFLFFDPSHQ